jgi:hypothetical protein
VEGLPSPLARAQGTDICGVAIGCLPTTIFIITCAILPGKGSLTIFKRDYSIMHPRVNMGLLVDGLGVLASVAEAVPVLGSSVKGSVEAVKQIVQYSEVST